MKESAVTLGPDRTLVGVVTEPDSVDESDKPAFLLLNAGFIHRVGPNRVYVKIARCLSELGYTVLRFDLSGIGDSQASTSSESHWQRSLNETRNAMDYLRDSRQVEKFVAFGICSGADLAYSLATRE